MTNKPQKNDGVINITTGGPENDARYLENLAKKIPELHPEAQEYASKYLSLRLELASKEMLRTFENIIEILKSFYQRKEHLPILTEEQKQEIIKINNMNISEFRKAEKAITGYRNWLNLKKAAGIPTRPYKKKQP